MFDDHCIRDPATKRTVAKAIALLLRAWDSVIQEEVLDAWGKTGRFLMSGRARKQHTIHQHLRSAFTLS
jgi:hypothetical protein